MNHRPTDRTHAPDGSPTFSELDRRQGTWADEQPIVTRCGHCDWTFTGAAAEARVEWREHLATSHPDELAQLKPSRRAKIARERENAMRLVEQRAGAAT